jgi:hypothetical protein
MTTDKTARKECPITRGVLGYFPDAIAAIANVSFVGGKQHHPGQPMHWDRSKSGDHEDCLVRHLMERGTLDDDGLRHTAKAAWRALALLQIELEESVPSRTPTVYVAGPMRGYPDLNFPAFHRAASLGRSVGFKVINPAEEDIKVGIDSKDVMFSLDACREFARRDVNLIFGCTAVAVLPGWEKSVGATAEVALARWLGLPILDARTFKALEAECTS